MYRTHNCNELRKEHIGKTVKLSGWVNSTRDHKGVIFVDLRDREGITQIVFRNEVNAEATKLSHTLHQEYVITIEGTVEERLKADGVDTVNKNLETGEIEIVVSDIKILNKSEVLPFQISQNKDVANEEIRLSYRYLDLRRQNLASNIKARHKVASTIREYLNENGFIEVETPILTKSTPEGARDFLVPSRLNPGKFYALPQAPQQCKQLLMVSGIEKYFQLQNVLEMKICVRIVNLNSLKLILKCHSAIWMKL